MNRVVVIVAAFCVVIGIAVTIWTTRAPSVPSLAPGPSAIAPQQFDTTGGQQLQPRWSQEDGPGK